MGQAQRRLRAVLRWAAGRHRGAGKAFLPLTVATGAMDAVTGGGYDGARGWATRGFGRPGRSAAAPCWPARPASSRSARSGSASPAPPCSGTARGALGNYVYDNWDNITEFGSNAVNWTGDRISDAAAGPASGYDAKDWAGDRLSDAGDTVEDVGTSAL